MMISNKPMWRNFFILYTATVIAQIANIAYESHMNDTDFLIKIAPSLLLLTILTAPALLIGLTLGPKIGIKAFDNRPNPTAQSIRHALVYAIVSSVVLGCVLIGVRWALVSSLPESSHAFGFRGFTGGVLVSLGAAIGEEVWFRFGLMTLVLWWVQKVYKQASLTHIHVLIVITIVGVLFGLAHLPQVNAAGAATPFFVWATILGNLAVSILYGWCFWRFGLVYAMVAHFSLDIVLHALPAIVPLPFQ